MIGWRGPIYTVEEVSDLLGIPRPTLYRYLREYSIPHFRRSGKISIPEESFDRIREARDLHKEGLGTESVRRVLREGGAPATGELGERLDALSETLRDLREKTAADEVVSSPALRTILARQSLLISAVFNLTEMVEDLLLASGKPRKMVFGEVAGELRAVTPLPEYAQRRQLEGPGGPTTVAVPARGASVKPSGREFAPARHGRFGYLSRRRRRGALTVLSIASILLVGGLLAWHLPALLGDQVAEKTPATAGQEAERDAANASGTANEDQASEESGDAAGAEAAGGAEAGEDPAGGGPASAPGGSAPGTRESASATVESASAAVESASATVGSLETRPGEVPDVSGRGVERAARALSRAGYTVAAIRTEASPEEAGTVTGTDPPAGTAAEPGAPVTIVVSGGPGGG